MSWVQWTSKRALLSMVGVFLLINLFTYSIFLPSNQAFLTLKGGFEALVTSWARSSSVLDDVYTFNTASLKSRSDGIVQSYHEQFPSYGLCLSVFVSSFSTEAREQITSCSGDDSIFTLNAEYAGQLVSGTRELSIGDSQLGNVTWYLVDKVPVWQQPATWWKYLSVALVSIMEGMLLHTWLIRREDKKESAMVEQANQRMLSTVNQSKVLEDALDDVRSRLNNIDGLIHKNKRHFPINKDIVYVSYKHPYSILHYSSGKTLQLRASLAEIEESFSINIVRVNRSTLICPDVLKSHGDIHTAKDAKGYEISLKIKGIDHNIVVSKPYEHALFSAIGHG